MVSRPLVFILLLSSAWLQVDALRKLVRAKRSHTMDEMHTSELEHLGGSSASLDAASMDPDGANFDDADKKELFSVLYGACWKGQGQIIDAVFSSQHDDAVFKELLMTKTNATVYGLPPHEVFRISGVSLLGVTMARLSDDEYDGSFWQRQVKHAMLVLAKLHVKYDVPLDAQFNGFYQLDRFRNMDVKLYLQEIKIEYVANSFQQIMDGFSEEKRKLQLEGTFMSEVTDFSKVTDATGKSFTMNDWAPLVNAAFPVKVELVVRNGAR